jgi:hypothetical protein
MPKKNSPGCGCCSPCLSTDPATFSGLNVSGIPSFGLSGCTASETFDYNGTYVLDDTALPGSGSANNPEYTTSELPTRLGQRICGHIWNRDVSGMVGDIHREDIFLPGPVDGEAIVELHWRSRFFIQTIIATNKITYVVSTTTAALFRTVTINAGGSYTPGAVNANAASVGPAPWSTGSDGFQAFQLRPNLAQVAVSLYGQTTNWKRHLIGPNSGIAFTNVEPIVIAATDVPNNMDGTIVNPATFPITFPALSFTLKTVDIEYWNFGFLNGPTGERSAETTVCTVDVTSASTPTIELEWV